jgi:phage terminase large subunit-like protein
MLGTPPTAVSSGTVFTKYREDVLAGKTKDNMWADWGIDEQTDPNNKAAWYQANPSLGTILTERKIEAEIDADVIDFNIQRLGLWIKYNQKSAISINEWNALKVETLPTLTGGLSVGIKYGADGSNVAMSIAVKTIDGDIFDEAIDCKSVRMGTDWIVTWLKRAKEVDRVIVDGASGQQILTDAMKDAKLKEPIIPKIGEIINANAIFEQAIYLKTLQHNGQPSLALVASNCDKRNIGSNGGFGYKALKPDVDIALLDSVILAHWGTANFKAAKKKQRAFC